MTEDIIKTRHKYKAVSTDDPSKMTQEDFEIIWAKDCEFYHGRILYGEKRHYCPEWDFMPIDETCEFEIEICTCNLEKKNV